MNRRSTKTVTLPKNEAIKVLRGKTMTTTTFGKMSSSTSFASTSRITGTAMTKTTFLIGSNKRMKGRRLCQTSTNSN